MELKVKELIEEFKDKFFMEHPDMQEHKSIQCAIISVNNTIKALNGIKDTKIIDDTINTHITYWEEFKQKLKKLL